MDPTTSMSNTEYTHNDAVNAAHELALAVSWGLGPVSRREGDIQIRQPRLDWEAAGRVYDHCMATVLPLTEAWQISLDERSAKAKQFAGEAVAYYWAKRKDSECQPGHSTIDLSDESSRALAEKVRYLFYKTFW